MKNTQEMFFFYILVLFYKPTIANCYKDSIYRIGGLTKPLNLPGKMCVPDEGINNPSLVSYPKIELN